MKDFNYYLGEVGEVGFVQQCVHSLVYAAGLPRVHPKELVVFENGDIGQVLSLNPETVQILLLSHAHIKVGSQVARTNEYLKIPVCNDLLGKTINPLGNILSTSKPIQNVSYEDIDKPPPSLSERIAIDKQLETGVALVDLIIPLGKGQRELIVGDRKTGKTEFLLQTIITQASKGTICIYAVIGQKQSDILKFDEFFQNNGIRNNTIIVASSSSDASGLIFLTPYTAMTVAEYFRNLGMDVLLILDDMTTHARTYREISLLGRRFPGRGSYPGDIFYMHAKLVERAGNFTKGSITCLPVAESVMGDLSGYIQTNLMSMTDGHIFFDIDLYNQGKRPSINPFLSVTRVGRQTQSHFNRDLSGTITSFLVLYERMKQFMHFGSEAGENVRSILQQGERLDVFFNQGTEQVWYLGITNLIVGCLWAGKFNDIRPNDLKAKYEAMIDMYLGKEDYRKRVDALISSSNQFSDLVNTLKRDGDIYMV